MKLKITRSDRISSHAEGVSVIANMSVVAGRNLAQVLQAIGIREVVMEEKDTFCSNRLELNYVRYFENVPDDVFKWSSNTLHGVVSYMDAFGLKKIELLPDENELATLENFWSSMSNGFEQRQDGADVVREERI